MYLRHPSLLILVGLARGIAISFDFARAQIVDYIMQKVNRVLATTNIECTDQFYSPIVEDRTVLSFFFPVVPSDAVVLPLRTQ
jgi:hypothetical protein